MTRRAAWAAVAIPFAALGAIAAYTHDAEVVSPLGKAGVLTVSLVAAAAALASCALYWRTLDEAAKEAHKAAWYWGGSAGLGVGGALVGFLMGRSDEPLPSLLSSFGEAEVFAAGAFTVVAAQLVGYLIVWAGWWLTKR